MNICFVRLNGIFEHEREYIRVLELWFELSSCSQSWTFLIAMAPWLEVVFCEVGESFLVFALIHEIHTNTVNSNKIAENMFDEQCSMLLIRTCEPSCYVSYNATNSFVRV
jgi:hypothetical protein